MSQRHYRRAEFYANEGITDKERIDNTISLDASIQDDGFVRQYGSTNKESTIMAETYRVATQGIMDGFSREQVADMLVILFKRTKEEIQPMLDPKGIVVKKGIDLATATKYKVELERCGCVCLIEQGIISAFDHPDALRKSAFSNVDQTENQKQIEVTHTVISETKATSPKPPELAMEALPPAPKPKPYPVNLESVGATPVIAKTRSVAKEVEEERDDDEIGKIASGQRLLIISVVLNLVFVRMKGLNLPWEFFFSVIILSMATMGFLRMAKGLGYSLLSKILLLPCFIIPIVNLIVLVITTKHASKRLSEAGFTVGWFGAGAAIPSSHDIRNILIGAGMLTLPMYGLVQHSQRNAESAVVQATPDTDGASLKQTDQDNRMGRTNADRQALDISMTNAHAQDVKPGTPVYYCDFGNAMSWSTSACEPRGKELQTGRMDENGAIIADPVK